MSTRAELESMLQQGFTIIGIWFNAMEPTRENPFAAVTIQKLLKVALEKDQAPFRTDGWSAMWEPGCFTIFFLASTRNPALHSLRKFLNDAGILDETCIGFFDASEGLWRTFKAYGSEPGLGFDILFGKVGHSDFSKNLMLERAAIEQEELRKNPPNTP